MAEQPARVVQLSTREIYRNQWLRLREDEVEFADGSRGLYSVIDKADFVVVLARENDGFWLVEQFRYPVGSREWEFPQGGWGAGCAGTQAELAAAELREETGLRSGALTHLGRLHAAYGFCSQGYDVFLATDLTPGAAQPEATESDLVARWHSDAEVRTMIAAGRLTDAHSIAALALYDLGAGS